MTNLQILERAWSYTLNLWGKEKEILDRNPEDIIAQHRATKYWNEVAELDAKIREEAAK